mgnify:CR=1 FL=1
MKHLHKKRLAVIGVGNIGRILIIRLLVTGVPPTNLVICDADMPWGQSAATEFGVPAAQLPDEAACMADIILLSPPSLCFS